MVRDSGAFAIYVHFPLCRNRCGYCEFATIDEPAFSHEGYADRVVAELEARASSVGGGVLRALYFGGGTPSLWEASALARVIAATRRFRWAEEVEITVEANPETLDEGRLAGLRQAGVNRLSVGVQSLDDRALRMLTRQHRAEVSVAGMALARAAGFDNISCDLIFGYQGQTVFALLNDLEGLVALAPEHISTYALTLAQGAPLRRAGHRPVGGDRLAEMMERGRGLLEAAGYTHYEVSNFAKRGRESVHNSMVWAGRPYLGLGASAHSTVRWRRRSYRVANPGYLRYLRAIPRGDPPIVALEGAKVEALSRATDRYEMMMLGLRTARGVDRRAYASRFGRDPLIDYRTSLLGLEATGLLRVNPARIAPTRRGVFFADEMALRLLP